MRRIELKVDLYTKVILTMIAISLLIIATERVFQPRVLSANPGIMDINIVRINGYAIRGVRGFLPVHVAGTVDVTGEVECK